ncbi:MAG: HAMP domain-containing sensor histidine kinase [Trueperaceae bacterium]
MFWRLLPSYVLVVAVSAVTAVVAGESFAPYFLERHVVGMMRGMHELGFDTMTGAMTADLAEAYRRALTGSLAWAVGMAVVAATLVGMYVTRRIVTPLRALREASGRIAGGAYEARLDASAPGEIGDLADAFNTMAADLEHSEGRRVALLGDVAHEFRTPLSSLKGYVEGIEDGVFPADEATLTACRRQLARLERLAEDLSLLSRVETGQLNLHARNVAVADLVARTTEAFRPRFDAEGVDVDVRLPKRPMHVRADTERTIQILSNLLANALRHAGPQGRVRIEARPEGHAFVRFDVIDDGPGVADEDLPHLFERFYRADKARRHDGNAGSGVGLTLVKQLTMRQGGTVGVANELGGGARFWFTLPMYVSGQDEVRGTPPGVG